MTYVGRRSMKWLLLSSYQRRFPCRHVEILHEYSFVWCIHYYACSVYYQRPFPKFLPLLFSSTHCYPSESPRGATDAMDHFLNLQSFCLTLQQTTILTICDCSHHDSAICSQKPRCHLLEYIKQCTGTTATIWNAQIVKVTSITVIALKHN